MMPGRGTQQEVSNSTAASWLNVAAAHQNPAATGVVHHYHNQSTIPVSLGSSNSNNSFNQTPASQMPNVRSATEIQAEMTTYGLHCGLGEESAPIMTCFAGPSTVISNRSLDTSASFVRMVHH